MDPFKLRDLIDQGSISSLGKVVGNTHPFSPFEGETQKAQYEAAMAAGATTFYARDRGEELQVEKFNDFQDYLAHHQYEEYDYILRKDGNWYVKCHSEPYILLTQALIELQVAEEN